jgi:hypothetical protein
MIESPLVPVIQYLKTIYGEDFFAGKKYSGFYIKKLSGSDLLYIDDKSRETHVAITDPAKGMRLFPFITSSFYESERSKGNSDPGDEKNRYRMKLFFHVPKNALLECQKNIITTWDLHKRKIKEHDLQLDLETVNSLNRNIISGYVTGVISIRSTGQRQLELGRSDDSQEWRQLLKALNPNDRLIFFLRNDNEYDLVPISSKNWDNKPSPLEEFWLYGDPIDLTIGNQLEDSYVALSADSSLEKICKSFCGDSAKIGMTISESNILQVTGALLSKRFLILTGLSGSGKTKLAQTVARWICSKAVTQNPFSIGQTVNSNKTSYTISSMSDDFIEITHKDDEETDQNKKLGNSIISLGMIREWVQAIKQKNYDKETKGEVIRATVKESSKYARHMNNMDSIIKAFAFAYLEYDSSPFEEKCYEIVPVGADWSGNENILGYPNGLNSREYITKPTLDLILRAERNLTTPYVLILDEMNLSHVERYFADILSIIESHESLDLYPGDMAEPGTWRRTLAGKAVPPKLNQLPENLFIIGTVNVDETTYMFSPKVLDRANVIEFRMDGSELEGFLGSPSKPDLSKLEGKGASFGKAFVVAAKSPVAVPTEVKAYYDVEMLLLFKTLQAHGLEFGFRTAYETARFIYFYKLLGNYAGGDTSWFPGAFDCVVFQKLLPKLHGSRAKLGPVLKKLWFLCVNDAAGRGADALKAAEEAARSNEKKAEPSVVVPAGAPYPLSAEKIGRMWRLLNENGFTSFAEA